MFRDAAALDRQRTATTFDEAIRRYAAQGEKWYDGTVDSVDRRLAVCERLRHSVRATVARLSINDSRRYLQAAETLDADRRVLTALRDDLLTGASGREDVVGPPGWRTAAPAKPKGSVAGSNQFSITNPPTGAVAGSNKFAKPPRKKKAPAVGSEQSGSIVTAHWYDKAQEAGHALPEGGPHPHGYSSVEDYVQARNLHDWINRSQDMTTGGGDYPVESRYEGDLGAPEHMKKREKALQGRESRRYAAEGFGTEHAVGGDELGGDPEGFEPQPMVEGIPGVGTGGGSAGKPIAKPPAGSKPEVHPPHEHGEHGAGGDHAQSGHVPAPPAQAIGQPGKIDTEEFFGPNSAMGSPKSPFYAPTLVPPEYRQTDSQGGKVTGGGADLFSGGAGFKNQIASPPKPPSPPKPVLAGVDRRWVALESARFVAANRDALDDSYELAVRAHNHAALKTSTLTRARSAAVCEAFVSEVGDLGRQSYRPAPVRTAAVYQDFDDSAMYVL